LAIIEEPILRDEVAARCVVKEGDAGWKGKGVLATDDKIADGRDSVEGQGWIVRRRSGRERPARKDLAVDNERAAPIWLVDNGAAVDGNIYGKYVGRGGLHRGLKFSRRLPEAGHYACQTGQKHETCDQQGDLCEMFHTMLLSLRHARG
jgi:hypothetical protein